MSANHHDDLEPVRRSPGRRPLRGEPTPRDVAKAAMSRRRSKQPLPPSAAAAPLLRRTGRLRRLEGGPTHRLVGPAASRPYPPHDAEPAYRTDRSGGTEPALQLPKKLYRVSEIAEHVGLTRQTLHNYATIGLITEEAQTPGGQRLFDESVFSRLGLIRHLKPTHRLREIRRLLEERASPKGPTAGADAIHPGRKGSPS